MSISPTILTKFFYYSISGANEISQLNVTKPPTNPHPTSFPKSYFAKPVATVTIATEKFVNHSKPSTTPMSNDDYTTNPTLQEVEQTMDSQNKQINIQPTHEMENSMDETMEAVGSEMSNSIYNSSEEESTENYDDYMAPLVQRRFLPSESLPIPLPLVSSQEQDTINPSLQENDAENPSANDILHTERRRRIFSNPRPQIASEIVVATPTRKLISARVKNFDNVTTASAKTTSVVPSTDESTPTTTQLSPIQTSKRRRVRKKKKRRLRTTTTTNIPQTSTIDDSPLSVLSNPFIGKKNATTTLLELESSRSSRTRKYDTNIQKPIQLPFTTKSSNDEILDEPQIERPNYVRKISTYNFATTSSTPFTQDVSSELERKQQIGKPRRRKMRRKRIRGNNKWSAQTENDERLATPTNAQLENNMNAYPQTLMGINSPLTSMSMSSDFSPNNPTGFDNSVGYDYFNGNSGAQQGFKQFSAHSSETGGSETGRSAASYFPRPPYTNAQNVPFVTGGHDSPFEQSLNSLGSMFPGTYSSSHEHSNIPHTQNPNLRDTLIPPANSYVSPTPFLNISEGQIIPTYSSELHMTSAAGHHSDPTQYNGQQLDPIQSYLGPNDLTPHGHHMNSFPGSPMDPINGRSTPGPTSYDYAGNPPRRPVYSPSVFNNNYNSVSPSSSTLSSHHIGSSEMREIPQPPSYQYNSSPYPKPDVMNDYIITQEGFVPAHLPPREPSYGEETHYTSESPLSYSPQPTVYPERYVVTHSILGSDGNDKPPRFERQFKPPNSQELAATPPTGTNDIDAGPSMEAMELHAAAMTTHDFPPQTQPNPNLHEPDYEPANPPLQMDQEVVYPTYLSSEHGNNDVHQAELADYYKPVSQQEHYQVVIPQYPSEVAYPQYESVPYSPMVHNDIGIMEEVQHVYYPQDYEPYVQQNPVHSHGQLNDFKQELMAYDGVPIIYPHIANPVVPDAGNGYPKQSVDHPIHPNHDPEENSKEGKKDTIKDKEKRENFLDEKKKGKFSSTPYVLMFPQLIPESTRKPPRPKLLTKEIPVVQASSLTPTRYSTDGQAMLGSGVRTLHVHPRHQMYQVLAAAQYEQKMRSYESPKKKPSEIYTPYGVLVPVGPAPSPPNSFNRNMAQKSSGTPKDSSPSSSVASSHQYGAQKNKYLMNVLLGIENPLGHLHFQTNSKIKNGRYNRYFKFRASVEPALDFLAEKLALKLSAVNYILKQPVKLGWKAFKTHDGSYSEHKPVHQHPEMKNLTMKSIPQKLTNGTHVGEGKVSENLSQRYGGMIGLKKIIKSRLSEMLDEEILESQPNNKLIVGIESPVTSYPPMSYPNLSFQRKNAGNEEGTLSKLFTELKTVPYKLINGRSAVKRPQSMISRLSSSILPQRTQETSTSTSIFKSLRRLLPFGLFKSADDKKNAYAQSDNAFYPRTLKTVQYGDNTYASSGKANKYIVSRIPKRTLLHERKVFLGNNKTYGLGKNVATKRPSITVSPSKSTKSATTLKFKKKKPMKLDKWLDYVFKSTATSLSPLEKQKLMREFPAKSAHMSSMKKMDTLKRTFDPTQTMSIKVVAPVLRISGQNVTDSKSRRKGKTLDVVSLGIGVTPSMDYDGMWKPISSFLPSQFKNNSTNTKTSDSKMPSVLAASSN